jgi:hypothetical protein
LTPYTGERRKIEFWNCLKTVPTEIIFSDAPRLTMPGYRWAPSTLLYGHGHIFGPRFGRITNKGIIGEFIILELEKKLRVEMKNSYQLLDVVTREVFRLFDHRDINPEDSSQPCTTICDAVAIKRQPTGELLPGTVISLVREENLDGEDIDDGIVGYQYRDKLVIATDEFAELVQWENLGSDALIVRTKLKTVRIS